MQSARPFPPSDARVAEARARGHLPAAALAGVGGASIGLGLSSITLAPGLSAAFRALFEAALRVPAGGSMERVLELLREITFTLAGGLGLSVLGMVLCIAFAQGLSRGHAASTSRRALPKLRVGRTARVLFALLLLLCAGLALDEALREGARFESIALSFVGRLALVAVPCVVIDIALARARFFASLFMSRPEALEEERASAGDPTLRAARKRAQHELRAGA